MICYLIARGSGIKQDVAAKLGVCWSLRKIDVDENDEVRWSSHGSGGRLDYHLVVYRASGEAKSLAVLHGRQCNAL